MNGHGAGQPKCSEQVIFGNRDSLDDDTRKNAPLRDDELAHGATCDSSQAYGRHRYIAAGQS